MTLTYKERESWMYRLEARLDQAVRMLCQRDPEGRLATMKRQARIAAAEELGIRSLLDKRDEVLAERDRLQATEEALRRQMLAQVSDEKVDDVTFSGRSTLPVEVCFALDRVTKKHLRVMLQETETGRTVLDLKRERREIEDTVMLAGSEQELQAVWASILERIGQTLSSNAVDSIVRDDADSPQN